MDKVFIPLVLGTGREGRQSEKVARYVYDIMKQRPDIATQLIDVRDYLHRPFTVPYWVETDEAKHWRDIIRKADGLVIVSPEYNYGYPGELKLLLDQAYAEYNRKPLGICGVSAGPIGGARMIQALRLTAVELQMVPLRNAVYFSRVKELFDENGAIQDSSYHDYVSTMLDELVWYANTLKTAREGKNTNQETSL